VSSPPGAAAGMLLTLGRIRPSLPVVVPRYSVWEGEYSDVASWAVWVLGDTTEPAIRCGSRPAVAPGLPPVHRQRRVDGGVYRGDRHRASVVPGFG